MRENTDQNNSKYWHFSQRLIPALSPSTKQYVKHIATRSSHWRCSVKKVFLKILQISQENTYVRVLFYKVAGLRDWNFIEMRLQHRCFPVKFAKFLRTPILKNISERLIHLILKNICEFILKNLKMATN